MSQGRFVWYDLVTPDLRAAQRFYQAVVGWKIKDAGHPTMAYTLLQPPSLSDGMGVAGMMSMPAEMGAAPPFWGGYIAVSDVDAAADRVTRLGGTVHRPPSDIPNVGRFAPVSDPQGAMFYLFAPNGSGTPAPESTPGCIGWRELHSTDPQAAFAFYSELVGWQKGPAMDMGPHGTYQLFQSAPDQRGGMMRGERSAWLFYFTVGSVDAAANACRTAGGKLLNEVHQEPEGGWIVRCRDPHGAEFALAGRNR